MLEGKYTQKIFYGKICSRYTESEMLQLTDWTTKHICKYFSLNICGTDDEGNIVFS